MSKLRLSLIPLVLLPYATTTQALSATTAQVINGSQPYLTFDGGVTKVTVTDGLLGITISDGITQTTYTPENNTSTASNPIALLKENQRFSDIAMLVPTSTNSITLSALIGAPNNYWGDDDGDGQGANGISATGNLSVSITDRFNNTVSRDSVVDICQAPYKVVLTSTDGSLTTQYGLPNSSNFSNKTATYYINPKTAPKICYARTEVGFTSTINAGPTDIWVPYKGFLPQSIDPSSYNRNFPTTGANNLHFDFLVGGIDGSTLTWPAVTKGGITATMTLNPPKSNAFNPDKASSVRVTLTGPVATYDQQTSASPGRIGTPTLPQTFELVGYDSNNRAVLKYGFVLKHWFVYRNKRDYILGHSSWCNNIGEGYRLPLLKELTNAKCGLDGFFPCVNGIDGATPTSGNNAFMRNIGGGFFSEWGHMNNYFSVPSTVYTYYDGSSRFFVYTSDGMVVQTPFDNSYEGICIYP